MTADLRQRMQARRERIKAGLPPPLAITVTENFFASSISNAAGRNMRQCSECGAEFVPHARQVTCSKACYARRKSKLRAVNPYELTCKECGAEFTSKRPEALVCGDACRRERKRRQKREWRRGNYDRTTYEPRQCAADGCIQVFTPVRPRQATCGSKRCQREYRLARKRMHNAAYVAKQRRVERERREVEVTA